MAKIQVVTIGKVGPAGSGVSSHEDVTNSIMHVRRVTSSTRPTVSSSDEGLIIYETDTNRMYRWDGTAWLPFLTGIRAIGVRANKTSDQSIANSSNVLVTFTGEDHDSDTLHDVSSNTSRITIPTGFGGIWLVTASAAWASGTGERWLEVLKNNSGAAYNASNRIAGVRDTNVNSTHIQPLCVPVLLAAGDHIEVYVRQTSGGSLNLLGTSDITWFGAHFLGVS